MDAFPTHSLSYAIDKSTLDAVGCDNDGDVQVEHYLWEVFRILIPGSIFVCISFGCAFSTVPESLVGPTTFIT